MKLQLIFVLINMIFIAVESETETYTEKSLRNVASEWQFPYQVSIRTSFDGHFCGGAILNKRFILTTANCVHVQIPDWIYAVYGTIQRNESNHRVDIKEIKVHNAFNAKTLDNDIALLQTVQEILFSYRVKSIELPPSYWSYVNYTEPTVSGWDDSEVSCILIIRKI